MNDKYMLLGEEQTVPEGKSFRTTVEVLGKGESLAEVIKEMPYRNVIASGHIYKLIQVELIEKRPRV